VSEEAQPTPAAASSEAQPEQTATLIAGAAFPVALTAVPGAVLSATRLVSHLCRYPSSVAAERAQPLSLHHALRGEPPVRRALLCTQVEAAFTPVLLVHGILDNRSVFRHLRRTPRQRASRMSPA
jgi:hypothetical protein